MRISHNQLNLNQIRERVSLPRILKHFGIEITGSNIACLWHPDSTPSLQIFDDGGFCHGCHKQHDIFDFVIKLRKCSFQAAVDWVLDYENILPESVALKAPSDYKGPVPIKLIDYWHGQLTEDRMGYLEGRLIDRSIVDKLRIGYRPDYNAYVIPYWSGIPGRSEVETLQYRAAPNNPTTTKYWGEKGHTKPSILNRDLLNKELLIIVFGVLDAVLARADGLPVWSTNGASVFSNPNRYEFMELRSMVSQVRQVFVIPDATASEFLPAQQLVDRFIWDVPETTIKFFPYSLGLKDYTEYRKSGKTADDFVREVIGMSDGFCWYDNRLYVINEDHVPTVYAILRLLGEGDGQGAYNLFRHAGMNYWFENYYMSRVTHAFQMGCDALGPQGMFSSDEWYELMEDFFDCDVWNDIPHVFLKWSTKMSARMGAF